MASNKPVVFIDGESGTTGLGIRTGAFDSDGTTTGVDRSRASASNARASRGNHVDPR